MSEDQPKPSLAAQAAPSTPVYEAEQRLGALFKTIRLDLVSALGEEEKLKQLVEDMPYLRDKVNYELRDAQDRSSRLLGQLRAVEKTLRAFHSVRGS